MKKLLVLVGLGAVAYLVVRKVMTGESDAFDSEHFHHHAESEHRTD